jgi:hypothetical protein
MSIAKKLLQKFFVIHPISWTLLGLIIINISATIPFGISDTANTDIRSITALEWSVSAVFTPVVIGLCVALWTKNRRLIDWSCLIGGSLWIGTATFSIIDNWKVLDTLTNLALFLIPLGMAILHFSVQRVTVLIPGAIEGFDVNPYKVNHNH